MCPKSIFKNMTKSIFYDLLPSDIDVLQSRSVKINFFPFAYDLLYATQPTRF